MKAVRAIVQVWVAYAGGVVKGIFDEIGNVLVLPRVVLVEVGDIFLLAANIRPGLRLLGLEDLRDRPTSRSTPATPATPPSSTLQPWFVEAMQVRSDRPPAPPDGDPSGPPEDR